MMNIKNIAIIAKAVVAQAEPKKITSDVFMYTLAGVDYIRVRNDDVDAVLNFTAHDVAIDVRLRNDIKKVTIVTNTDEIRIAVMIQFFVQYGLLKQISMDEAAKMYEEYKM
ncbi:MAG: hypothetical protein ACRC3J_05050 [Culicoidibacterales bacterium]